MYNKMLLLLQVYHYNCLRMNMRKSGQVYLNCKFETVDLTFPFEKCI